MSDEEIIALIRKTIKEPERWPASDSIHPSRREAEAIFAVIRPYLRQDCSST